MTDLTFSIYGNQPSHLEDPAFLLDKFQKQQRVTMKVERMPWDDVWGKLLSFALHGGGPHVSLIGAVWTSTLAAMNVLRPFTTPEIAAAGGVNAFPAAAWQNARLVAPDKSAWGIPFNLFSYFVWYRRDLLQRASVTEAEAFQSAEALRQTVQQLRAAGIPSPLLLPSGQTCRPRLHMAASWVWGAGGDFVNAEGEQLIFDQPAALAGLTDFLDLYRLMAPADYNLSLGECDQRFAAGQAAITFSGAGLMTALTRANNPQVLDNWGVAAMPGQPWMGGANLVIWKETQAQLEAERAALALVRFLTSQAAQVKYAQAERAIPACLEALPQVDYGMAPYQAALSQTILRGRAYRPLPLWMRVMNDLHPALDAITAEVLAKPGVSTRYLVQSHIPPLAQRFNLMLGR